MTPNFFGGSNASSADTAASLNAFGLKLLADLTQAKPNHNVFISPLSVFFALAMTETGAAGPTRSTMRQVLAVPDSLSEDDLQQSSSSLLKSLQSDKGVQLSIANALWADLHHPFTPAFVERCHNFYQADATSLDFAQPGAADTINAWVKEKTQAKIPTIVSPAAVRASTAILTNAVYFKGGWEYKFDKNETKEGDFHLASGSAANVKKIRFMHRSTISRGYLSGDGFEAAVLPYSGSRVTLYAILPTPGKTPEEGLAAAAARQGPSPSIDLELTLPRFTADFADSLKVSLERMGMQAAFRADADFTPMSSTRLFIGDVLHKTRLEVDEEGTVAAAATTVMMSFAAVVRRPDKKTLVFDRPFALILRDNITGAILFAGVIYDPQ